MLFRIRFYILIVAIEILTFFAFWAFWTFPEVVLFDIYRDMGIIESLQLLLLSAIGLSACLMSRYRNSSVDDFSLDFAFCQFIGAGCFLLIFRELDYYMTEFMNENQFLLLWSAVIAMTVIYGIANLKKIARGLQHLVSTRSFWFLAAGGVLYLVIAQIIGTKQFRNLFYPYAINFSRRYIEESIELIGLLIAGFGTLELHLELVRMFPVRLSKQVGNWKEDVWRSFTALPHEVSGGTSFKKAQSQSARGESQMTIEQQTLPRQPQGGEPATVMLPESVSRQLEELVFVAQKVRRSNASFSATILFIGICLITSLLWLGFVFRENAIEYSTNFQMELLQRQYESQVQQFQAQPKKWKERNPMPDFRYEQLRAAIHNDVETEYNFSNFFKREPHRLNP
ncbi:MAG: hypothetical protein HY587_08630 [Candidatus Omnitrophica bacterium]|nr:hypothetical protein [Candidatus Omnitrophota bacterium]